MGHDENMLLLRRGYGQYGQPLQIKLTKVSISYTTRTIRITILLLLIYRQPLQITLSAMTPLDEAVQRSFFFIIIRAAFTNNVLCHDAPGRGSAAVLFYFSYDV
jgi:hypothetical protein